jgi:protein-S-isoprenylcysteine O-methyltransferase Ste14
MACGLAALLLALRAWSDLGPAFRVRPEPRAGAQLVRRGVYRRLRHPMYTSVCLIAVGMFLHHPGTTTLLLALANLGFYVAKARYEESLLRRRFADYPSYRTQTHGVIPWAAGRAASKNPSRRGRSH